MVDWTLFAGFESKSRRLKEAIANLETAIENKRAEEADAAGRLRDSLTAVRKDLDRLPVAGALVWRGSRR